jgi:hypothetical protein
MISKVASPRFLGFSGQMWSVCTTLCVVLGIRCMNFGMQYLSTYLWLFGWWRFLLDELDQPRVRLSGMKTSFPPKRRSHPPFT